MDSRVAGPQRPKGAAARLWTCKTHSVGQFGNCLEKQHHAVKDFQGVAAFKIKLFTKVLKMKKITFSTILIACLALSGCATQNVLKPTPEEAARFAQHKLVDVPSSQEALIYVINWTRNDKDRIHPLHVQVGVQEKIVEPEQYSIFRVKPEAFNITVTGMCRRVTGEQLKSTVSNSSKSSLATWLQVSYYGELSGRERSGKTYVHKKDAKLFVAEAGKTYFLWINPYCFFNIYDGSTFMFTHINTVTEEEARYLTFRTRQAH